jgi:hypothetical protein
VNAWIGSGWCAGTGPWGFDADGTISANAGQGVNRQRPHLGNAGRGVNRQLPHLGTAGQGVNRQLPHLGTAGQGVNRQLPHLGNAGLSGYNRAEYLNEGIYLYFDQLATKLRHTRVCNGDWTRVVTNGALSYGGTVGIFLDPPYLGDVRTADLYACDDHTISHAVREWALTNGTNPRYRIVLAGYGPEHDHLMPPTWRRLSYSASAAYQTTAAAERTANGDMTGNGANRHTEMLWYSPHCLRPTEDQLDLFGASA